MDPKKPAEVEKSEPVPPSWLPPASTSYPFPTGPDQQGAIRYPEPSAPPQPHSPPNQSGFHGVPPPMSAGGPGPHGAYGGTSAASMQNKHPQPTMETYPQHHEPQPPQKQPLPSGPQSPHHSGQTREEDQQEPNGRATSASTNPTAGGGNVQNLRRDIVIKVEEKSLLEAYILWFPLGIIGLHQFYLGRVGMGFLYFFTMGLFGVGWLVDLCRMPSLVRQCNEKRRRDAARGYVLYAGPYEELTERSLCSAYLFWLPPVGLLGGHHYYLGRIGYGVAYTFTLGIFGVGWLIDSCRMWALTKRTNEDIKTLRSGQPLSTNPAERMHLDDAYCLAFPLGFLGLHHFYMRRWGFGIAYLLTVGCMGVGFIVDLFRLPCLLSRTKRELAGEEKKFHVDDAYVLWFPLGIIGLHHFYLHRWIWGVAYFLTLGFFGIGWLIDLCRIPSLVRNANERRATQLLINNQTPTSTPGYSNYDSPQSSVEHTNTTQGGIYNTVPTPQQGNMAVYAFPLDPHGRPIWTEGVSWDDDRHRQAFQSQFPQQPQEPPPPYSQY